MELIEKLIKDIIGGLLFVVMLPVVSLVSLDDKLFGYPHGILVS